MKIYGWQQENHYADIHYSKTNDKLYQKSINFEFENNNFALKYWNNSHKRVDKKTARVIREWELVVPEPPQQTILRRWGQTKDELLPIPAAQQNDRVRKFGFAGIMRFMGMQQNSDLSVAAKSEISQKVRAPSALLQSDRLILHDLYSSTNIDTFDNYYGEHFYDSELAGALPEYAVEVSDSQRLMKVLKWLDEKRAKETHEKSWRLKRDDDGVFFNDLLTCAYQEFELPEVKDSFGIKSFSRTPLSLIALMRLDDRQGFMDLFRGEFDIFRSKAEQLQDVTNEMYAEMQKDSYGLMEIAERTNPFIGRMYEGMRHARRLVRAADLRIASLAFSYHHRLLTPQQLIANDASQQLQWQTSVATLCALPLAALPLNMQELVIDTVNLCIDMPPKNDFGERTSHIVQYLAANQMDIDDESHHTDAWWHIQSIAGGN